MEHSLALIVLLTHSLLNACDQLESSIAFQEAVKEIEDKIREVEKRSDTMTGR